MSKKTLVELPQTCYIRLSDQELDSMPNIQREILGYLNLGPLSFDDLVERTNRSRTVCYNSLSSLKELRLVGERINHIWYLEP